MMKISEIQNEIKASISSCYASLGFNVSKSPMDLSGFPLFHPERKRRDIWWVEKDGKSLDKLLINASRIINKNAIKWLDKFSDPDYLVRYLKIGKEIDSWKGGPFGFGAIGSPFRQDAINKLEKWMTRTS